MHTISFKKNITIFAFLVLPFIQLMVFTYYAILNLGILSFSDWNGFGLSFNFIGFKNYKDVFSDPQILVVFRNVTAYMVIGIFDLFLALYFAIILNGKIKARNFFKSAIFMPFIINSVATVLIFSYFYSFEYNPINVLLNNFGLGEYAIHFFGRGYISNYCLAGMGIWKYTGYTMVLFLGVLQSIPDEQYESADIDGANFFHKIRYIILPNLSNIIILILFLSINGALQAFNESFIMFPQGSPNDEVATFLTKSFDIGFKFENYGKASAMAILLLLVVVSILILQKIFLKEREE